MDWISVPKKQQHPSVYLWDSFRTAITQGLTVAKLLLWTVDLQDNKQESWASPTLCSSSALLLARSGLLPEEERREQSLAHFANICSHGAPKRCFCSVLLLCTLVPFSPSFLVNRVHHLPIVQTIFPAVCRLSVLLTVLVLSSFVLSFTVSSPHQPLLFPWWEIALNWASFISAVEVFSLLLHTFCLPFHPTGFYCASMLGVEAGWQELLVCSSIYSPLMSHRCYRRCAKLCQADN